MTGFKPGSSGFVSDRPVNCSTTTAKNKLVLTGFKPRSSCVESDCSVNCATTTAKSVTNNFKIWMTSRHFTSLNTHT